MPGAVGGDMLLKGTEDWRSRARPAALGAMLAGLAVGAALLAWAASADPHWAERHVLTSRCATNEGEWVLARGARWVAAAVGLAALALAPALARRARPAPPHLGRGSVVGVALAIAASLVVTELYLRHLHDRLAPRAPPERDAAMTRVDARLGWAHVPGRTTWARVGGRAVAYAIDADGDRAASADHVAPRAARAVLFAGESIAFGYGLPWDETFPAQVAQRLGVEAVNLAVIGYGSDQAYLRVVDALPRSPAPLAVVTLFVPEQVKRNVDPWRPRLVLGPDGALSGAPPEGGPRLLRLVQQLPYHGDDALRVTAAVLRATAAAARARGAFPLFVVTNYGPPCRHEAGREAFVVDELFVRQGLPFVRVDLGPEDRLPGLLEGHPNQRGTRKLADAVEQALRAHLAPPTPSAGGTCGRR
jgi:hypothetical protein